MLRAVVSQKHKVVLIPPVEGSDHLFPSAVPLQIKGEQLLAVPHGVTETFLLRRMGFDIPSPILSHYDWCGGKPFEVQRKTCALLTMNERAFVLSGLGTGKTKTALWSWHYLRSNSACKKLLVIAPLSTLVFTWQREVFSTIPGTKAVVLHGTKAQRLKSLNDTDADIYIINHDGVKVIQEELEARDDIDAVVIDELAVYRNPTSKRTKALREFAKTKRIVWGMTGSPIPNAPTDAWAQASIVKPDNVPRYFTRFRDELMYRHGPFLWLPKSDAIERAYAALTPSVRFTLDDVAELPEVIERSIDVELTKEQEKTYKALAAHAQTLTAKGDITAVHAGALMMKLLQVATGWVYTNDKQIVELDNNIRMQAVLDIITSASNKVLVFVPFKHALDGIHKALEHEKIEHEVVSGDTPSTRRNEIFNLFQNTDKYKVLLAHPQCLAHGITLTAADTIIWFAPVTSLEIYEQANHRIRRVGQKHKQQIIHLQSTKVEKRIYTLLRQRKNVQDQLLDLIESVTRDTILK